MIRTILILSCALAGLVGLAAGFIIGYSKAPAPAAPAPHDAPSGALLPDEPLPPPVIPLSPENDAAEKEPGGKAPEIPIKVISPPEAALKAFLSAPDWRSRLKHILHAERLAAPVEDYYRNAADGPVAATSLRAGPVHTDDESGIKVAGFRIATETRPEGFEVAVMETPEGWKVDWEAFVEFQDDHFARFVAGEGGATGIFHLKVRNTHYFREKFPGIENLTAFLLSPPMPGRDSYGFVATGSDLHKSFAASIEWGQPCMPVLEIARRPLESGKSYLEITRIVAPNWRPEPE